MPRAAGAADLTLQAGAPGRLMDEVEGLDGQLVVVGQWARVADGAIVPPGKRTSPAR